MRPRRLPGLGRALAPLVVLPAIVVLFLPLSPAYDLDVYLRAGFSVLHGLQVYPRPGSAAVYSGFSFVYPYFAVLPFVPLAALPAGLSTTLFFVISACAVLAACLIAAEGDPRPAVLVLCTSFTITGLQLGALSPLLFAGAVFLWWLRDRPVAFALLAAPVLASKLFLLPLLAWLVLARRDRTFVYASALTVILLAAGFAVGPLGPIAYLHMLSALGTHEARAGFGLIGALMKAGLTSRAAEGAAAALSGVLFAASYFHYRRTRDERVLFCAAVVASLILSPVLWSHYLLLLAAALLALNAPRRWFVALALASWVIARPHGVRLDLPLPELVETSGAWPAIAASLLVFAYAAAPRRIRQHPDPG